MLGAKIARDNHLISWDWDHLCKWAVTVQLPINLKVAADRKEELAASNLIRQFLHEVQTSTLILSHDTKAGRNFVMNGHVRDVRAEMNEKDRMIYINRGSLKLWCNIRHHDMDALVKDLVTTGLVVEPCKRYNIGENTSYERGPTYCVWLVLNHKDATDMKKVLDNLKNNPPDVEAQPLEPNTNAKQ